MQYGCNSTRSTFTNSLNIMVFKGAFETLKNIDYIISEVNKDEVYENCAHVDDLDSYLNQFNFQRVETNWIGGTWGDAFYIK
jgi:hypothetical protein